MSDTATRFAAAARDYSAWIQGGEIDARAAFDHLAALSRLARTLPEGTRHARRPARPGHPEVQRLRHRLTALPIHDYAIVDPYPVEPPDEPMLGNLPSDLIEIYLALHRGLTLWGDDRDAAIWDWRINFSVRWRAHARDALWVLDRVLADAE